MRYVDCPELVNNTYDSHLSGLMLIARSHRIDNSILGNNTEKTFPLSLMQRVILHTPSNESQLRGYDMNGNDCEVI